jgi:peptidyl-prolyl cis-trans isomerase SurA
MNHNRTLLHSLVVGALTTLLIVSAQAEEVVDSVVAAVDNEPITLKDLSAVQGGQVSKDQLQGAGNDETKKALDITINRYIVEQEAKTQNVQVTPEEIDSQINELATRNNLTLSQFKDALELQGQSLDSLKREIKFQILRSKIVAHEIRGSSTVSEEDINRYVEAARQAQTETEDDSDTTKVNFSYILFQGDSTASLTEAERVANSLSQKVPFADVVSAYGDRAQVGIDQAVAEEDLHESLRDALLPLKPGESSEPVKTEQGYLVVQKSASGPSSAAKTETELRQEARAALEGKNIEEKAQKFLADELPKKHIVELAPGITRDSKSNG